LFLTSHAHQEEYDGCAYCTRESQMRKTDLPMLLLVFALAACGQGETGGPPAVAQPTASLPAATEQPTAEPTIEPPPATFAPAAGQPGDALVARAREQLAQRLGLSEDALILQSASAQEWPDAGLGCPQPDQVYAQVITPGFLLTFAADGTSYEVHTDEQGSLLVLCENGQPTDLTAAAPPAAATGVAPDQGTVPALDETTRPLVEKAQQTLSSDLGVSAADVRLVALEPTEWSDSSLGCPKPGMNYLQVITPGYRLVLEAQGQRYEFHTDQRGTVVRCDGT
jgi:hypothetical protein